MNVIHTHAQLRRQQLDGHGFYPWPYFIHAVDAYPENQALFWVWSFKPYKKKTDGSYDATD